MTTKREIVKLHHEIVHMMPVEPSRKRKKGFVIERCWGNTKLIAEAFESLNYYDMITLGFIARAFLQGTYEEASRADDGRARVNITLDVEAVVKERGLLNKIPNRRTFIRSVERWHKTHLTFKTENEVRHTWLISDMEYDTKFKQVSILANKRWLELCVEAGIVINLGRLLKYGDNGVAVLIDMHLQGTKQRTGNGGYMFRSTVSEAELFELLDYDGGQQHKELRRQINEAFALMERHGMPPYEYDKIYKCWRRADYLHKREI